MSASLALTLAELADPAPVVPAPDWSDALCRQVDPELWFPEKGQRSDEPKRICRACPIRAECLAWALANNERYGVWGGLSERERRGLKDRQTAFSQVTESTEVPAGATMAAEDRGGEPCSDSADGTERDTDSWAA